MASPEYKPSLKRSVALLGLGALAFGSSFFVLDNYQTRVRESESVAGQIFSDRPYSEALAREVSEYKSGYLVGTLSGSLGEGYSLIQLGLGTISIFAASLGLSTLLHDRRLGRGALVRPKQRRHLSGI